MRADDSSGSKSKSSAPADKTASMIWSSDLAAVLKMISPFWSNWKAAEPEVPRLPPDFERACLISAVARFLLSVRAEIRTGMPFGPCPSKRMDSIWAASLSKPAPVLMALSMLLPGMLVFLALEMAMARDGLSSGSGPDLAAMVMSLECLEKTLPLWASVTPFFLWILAHLECPDMVGV